MHSRRFAPGCASLPFRRRAGQGLGLPIHWDAVPCLPDHWNAVPWFAVSLECRSLVCRRAPCFAILCRCASTGRAVLCCCGASSIRSILCCGGASPDCRLLRFGISGHWLGFFALAMPCCPWIFFAVALPWHFIDMLLLFDTRLRFPIAVLPAVVPRRRFAVPSNRREAKPTPLTAHMRSAVAFLRCPRHRIARVRIAVADHFSAALFRCPSMLQVG